jgi:hypothetical protein
MIEQIKFLQNAVQKLLELAASAPEVADDLRALAAELEMEVRRLQHRLRPQRH